MSGVNYFFGLTTIISPYQRQLPFDSRRAATLVAASAGGSVAVPFLLAALKTGEGLVHREAGNQEQQARGSPPETLCIGRDPVKLRYDLFLLAREYGRVQVQLVLFSHPDHRPVNHQPDEHTSHDTPNQQHPGWRSQTKRHRATSSSLASKLAKFK